MQLCAISVFPCSVFAAQRRSECCCVCVRRRRVRKGEWHRRMQSVCVCVLVSIEIDPFIAEVLLSKLSRVLRQTKLPGGRQYGGDRERQSSRRICSTITIIDFMHNSELPRPYHTYHRVSYILCHFLLEEAIACAICVKTIESKTSAWISLVAAQIHCALTHALDECRRRDKSECAIKMLLSRRATFRTVQLHFAFGCVGSSWSGWRAHHPVADAIWMGMHWITMSRTIVRSVLMTFK